MYDILLYNLPGITKVVYGFYDYASEIKYKFYK